MSHPTPMCLCLACGKHMNRAANAKLTDDDNLDPTPGDVAVCFGCGYAMFYTDELRLRDPTREEELWLALHPDVTKIRMLIRARDKLKTAKERQFDA